MENQNMQPVSNRRRSVGSGRERTRGRVSLRTVGAGGVVISTLAGVIETAMWLSCTDVTTALIIWGSVVLFVALAVAAMYLFGKDTLSPRAWQLLCVWLPPVPDEYSVEEAARVTVPSQGAREAGPVCTSANRPAVPARVLDPAGSPRVRPGRLTGRAENRPSVPPQRRGPEGHPPRPVPHGARPARSARRR